MPKQKDIHIYSVSSLSNEIKSLIEFEFKDIWVLGEVSNFKKHSPSGHQYFSLKDQNSIINCILFKSYASKIKFSLENGLNVRLRGSLSLYPKRGEYQIIVSSIKPEGIGELQFAFEQLKQKLFREGLFNREFKKPIPTLPKRLGVITSPTGAAIRDILSVCKRRFDSMDIVIYPVLAQGDYAYTEIVNAIRLADHMKLVDTLIIGRGGGSIEDLWAFNEEEVARAIFKCSIPIISAVGHEIDFTISDYVADLRAPTPSAAAEIALPNKYDLIYNTSLAYQRLNKQMELILKQLKDTMSFYKEDSFIRFASNTVNNNQLQTDYAMKHLNSSIKDILSAYNSKFNTLYKIIKYLSPKEILKRGYSIVYKDNGNKKTIKKTIIKDHSILKANDNINIKFSTGTRKAIVK